MDRGIAIVVGDGVQVPQPEVVSHRDRLDRKTEGGSTVVRSSALGFLRRIIARVAGYITKIRRFFALTQLAKEENCKGSVERGVTRNAISVEEGLVGASGACEPQLAEIIVSDSKETSTNAMSNTMEMLGRGDRGSICWRTIPVDNEQPGTCDDGNSTLRADNHGAACKVERGSSSEQAAIDPFLQKPADTATDEPDKASSPVPCSAQDADRYHSQAQARDASREDFAQNECVTAEAPSPLPCASDSKLETSVDESAFRQTPSSKNTKKKFSLRQLNAMVTEQLTEYLQVLERTTVPGTLNQSQHRRAIIVATLAAVAVWARNSKHLHESEPRIKGSCINVHIRSRL